MESSSSKRVSKACDACKLRKVKCNGQIRCQQCSHLGLLCVYSASSSKRAQGKRGRIISEYKNKTANPSLSSPPILAASPGHAHLSSPIQDVAYHTRDNGGNLDPYNAQPNTCSDLYSSFIVLTETQGIMTATESTIKNTF